MTMRALLLAVALAPTPALAAYDCTLQMYCTMLTCEPLDSPQVLVKAEGDVWTLTFPDTPPFTGTAIAGGEDSNRITIAFPPQPGPSFDEITGLLDIFPTGQLVLTTHTTSGGGVMDMTGLPTTYNGLCAGEGG
jgi:hypothetical protein